MSDEKEKQTVTSADVGKLSDVIAEDDPFKEAEALPGHENLGRVITDSNGQLSGSPANYEALRGRNPEAEAAAELPQVTQASIDSVVSNILAELQPDIHGEGESPNEPPSAGTVK